MRKMKIFGYYVCKLVGLFRISEWLTRDELRILCYHGFAMEDEGSFRPSMFIDPSQFATRLKTLKRYGHSVLPLDRAVAMLYSGTLPKRAVVITVDDGFYSFYREAVPCLHHYDYPATVYVTTYYVEHANPVFRLVVQYMFWKTQKTRLELVDELWSVNQTVDLTRHDQVDRVMWSCINYGERECTEDTRVMICQHLGVMLATPYENIVESRIMTLMNPAELRSLIDSNVDVQLHTHRHVLPKDNESLAIREIVENREAIKRLLGTDASHFCYPSGLWHKQQWALLENLDIRSSTTCVPGLNTGKTPRQALRRFLDGGNVHQLEFEAHLCGFVSLIGRLGKGVWGMRGKAHDLL